MRVDFELGAFKFMYIDSGPSQEKSEESALRLFERMVSKIQECLPKDIVEALIAADPKVVEAEVAYQESSYKNKLKNELSSIVGKSNV